MAIAEVMYSDQAVLQERMSRRQVRLDIVRGTLRFARWSVVESFRATGYLFGFTRPSNVASHADAPIVVKTNNAQIPGKAPQCLGHSWSADPMRNSDLLTAAVLAAAFSSRARRPTRKACCRHLPARQRLCRALTILCPEPRRWESMILSTRPMSLARAAADQDLMLIASSNPNPH
jgi:hypothetical protein